MSTPHRKAKPSMSTSPEHAADQQNTHFDEYFRSNYVRLVRWLIFSGATGVEAHDAIQSAMEAAFRHWPRISTPDPYVRKVAMRYFLRERARAAREKPTERTAAEPVATTHFEYRAEVQEVRAALASLPPAQRFVVALSMDGYTPKEISQLLEKPSSTVRSHLRFARRALRSKLIRGHGQATREEVHDGP
ncbi:sigma-70 family RNA polymerase sigma factor [Cryptosporangium sp. NPDC051539]|uniref:sigma-70 family RNA polymerase sigma factor n=1 Tax=Cryptosporangium sp. NPDC051539 TaxID=3363962 RepID=UPI0037B059E7